MVKPRTADEAVELAASVAAPFRERSAVVDAEARWPEENLRALQGSGLGGLVVPVEDGGLGLGLFAVVRVCETIAEHCASTAICFGMHCVGTAVIAARATAHHRSRYLEPIARGDHLTTLALSEPGTGANFYLPETRASVEDNGAVVLRGIKSFVTNGGHADSYVMSTASADPSAAPGEFSCFVVPGDNPALKWSADWHGWGMRGNSARSVTLDSVRLTRSELLGSEGDEIWYVFNVVAPYFLCAMSGTYLGIARDAVGEVQRHLLGRVYSHTGQSIASDRLIQHRFGTLWAHAERIRTLVYSAAVRAEAGAADALPALCSAKAEVGEVERVVAEGMSMMGGRAYAQGSRMHRLYRDSQAAHVMAPTTEMLRVWAGRALLDRPLLSDGVP